jgi:hypothetical protein
MSESKTWVRNLSPHVSLIAVTLQQSYKGIPIAIGPWFESDEYEDFVERNAPLLDEIMSGMRSGAYIDYIEIRMDSAIVHMRRSMGRVIPDHPSVIFEARWVEPKVIV